ncbi:MAG: hypothetical protein S4CHLAM102_05260 [Chlamydiia bacterium]|nr:hypothetical protein [Chlamydiia bacterium]
MFQNIFRPISPERLATVAHQGGWNYSLFHHTFDRFLFGGGYRLSRYMMDLDRPAQFGRLFLEGMGGQTIDIKLPDGGSIDGVFIHPRTFKQKMTYQHSIMSGILSNPLNHDLKLRFDVNLRGKNIFELFRLPPAQPISTQIQGLFVCLGANVIYENALLQALFCLQYDLPVILFNYRGVGLSKGVPTAETACTDGVYVARYLQERLRVPFEQLGVIGSSMGGAVAAFAAAECPGLNLFLDRTFARITNVSKSPLPGGLGNGFVKWMCHYHYPFSTIAHLKDLKGRLLILEGELDNLMKGEAEKIYQVFASTRPNAKANKHLIRAPGGHFGYPHDLEREWMCSAEGQALFSKFLSGELG